MANLTKPQNTEQALLLAQAIEHAAINDAAAVYQQLLEQATTGKSWRASEAFLKMFLQPILDQTRLNQHGADLPQAIEDGTLGELLTSLAERIAERGGIDLTTSAGNVSQGSSQTTGASIQSSGVEQQAGGAGPSEAREDPLSIEDRLDRIRIGIIRRRVDGSDPLPRSSPVEHQPSSSHGASKPSSTPPTPSPALQQGGGEGETMEPPGVGFVEKIGGNEVIGAGSVVDVEYSEVLPLDSGSSSGGVDAVVLEFRRRKQGGSD